MRDFDILPLSYADIRSLVSEGKPICIDRCLRTRARTTEVVYVLFSYGGRTKALTHFTQ